MLVLIVSVELKKNQILKVTHLEGLLILSQGLSRLVELKLKENRINIIKIKKNLPLKSKLVVEMLVDAYVDLKM